MILDDIVAVKRQKLALQMQNKPLDSLMAQIDNDDTKKQLFKSALETPGLSVIAEVKKASPSKGVICEDFRPKDISERYEKYGADAISVLTEENFFLGSNEYLQQVKDTVEIPVLRKDFIIDIWQVYESKVLGADAILLIAAILTDKQLAEFREAAQKLGLCALVETHNEQEMKKALGSGAKIIGINNRDLKTFEVSLKTTENLIRLIPPGKVIVSESGINTADDARFLRKMGADAVLVGESLMRAGNVKDKLKELKSGKEEQ